ncbi:MAG: hypothetical protein ACRD96_07055 [Bryobacteraceae bacterium]
MMQYIDRRWRSGHVLSRDRELLEWQYDPRLVVHGDFAGVTVQLAWQGGTIVGMLGLTGFVLSHDGIESPGVWLSNWYANPECRGQNVALRLLWSVQKLGYEVMATLGANEVSAPIFRSLRFDVLEDLPRWVAVFDAASTATLLAEIDGQAASGAWRGWCDEHLIRSQPAIPGASQLEVLSWTTALAPAWDAFWSAHLAPHLVGTMRDARYLQWRYVEHPRFAYDVRVARERRTGSVRGCTVFRVEQVLGREEKVLRVVEFLASPDAEACLAVAVAEAGRRHGVSYADFYCSSARGVRGLEAIGFALETRDGDWPSLPTRLCPLEPGHFAMTIALRGVPAVRGRIGDLQRSGWLYVTKSDGDQDRPN